MFFDDSFAFAKELDNKDPLRHFREEFIFPNYHSDALVYFTGNSLGLQPKKAKTYIL